MYVIKINSLCLVKQINVIGETVKNKVHKMYPSIQRMNLNLSILTEVLFTSDNLLS